MASRHEALSELVQDTAEQLVANANYGGGESAQIEFLLAHGWDRDEIEQRLTDTDTTDPRGGAQCPDI